MGWRQLPVFEQRWVLVQRVLQLHQPVSAVAREFGVSRKTAHKWIKRYRLDPGRRLTDRSLFLINDRFQSFSVSPDGKRILMIQRDPGSAPRQLNVILNWSDAARSR